jgi:hypothetical protein
MRPPASPGPTLGRSGYALVGGLLFGLKHNLDRVVASAVFGRQWSLFNYLVPPEHGTSLLRLSPGEIRFYGTMLGVALPFILAGVVLTLRRLRSAGLPEPLVLLFFVPAVNLAFFLVLCVVPPRDSPGRGGTPQGSGRGHADALDRIVPRSAVGSAIAAVAITVVLGALAVLLGVGLLERYGWGLFVGVPFAMGLTSALVYGYHAPRRLPECLLVALLGPVLLATALLLFAVEGVLCLAMAGPIAAVLALFGGAVGYVLQRRRAIAASPAVLAVVLLSAPLLMTAEHASPPEAPLFAVTTAVDVAASPDVVWERVVAFGEIAPPGELLFRAGVAYPTRATLEGAGVGAVRRCVFTTGAFVEPITAWEPPQRLAFAVGAEPPPLQEWTPWADVRPAHLDGYFRSERGEFRLVALSGGRTRLEGTTWYRHDLWPAAYWRLWSDAIVHRIHARVLEHIRTQAEASPAAKGIRSE